MTRYDIPADRAVYVQVTSQEQLSVNYLDLFIAEFPEQKIGQFFSARDFYGAINYKSPRANQWKLKEDSGHLMPAEIFMRVGEQPGKGWAPLPEGVALSDYRAWKRMEAKRTEAIAKPPGS